MAEPCFPTQIISCNGKFNVPALGRFLDSVNSRDCISYDCVAIIGPQSSGKSTFLNYSFGTHFSVMDAGKGRSQTTTGIWIAKAATASANRLTLVMDLEGTDSRVRGEDTAFEKRSALFALAVADTVIINIWCNGVGLHNAACRPLLKTVLEVNMRLFASKKRLLFVIRDKDKTPFDKLKNDIKEDFEKIWEELPKHDAYKGKHSSEIFNVEVIALASYVDKKELFEKEVAELRQQFFESTIPQVLVPLQDFKSCASEIWKRIKENKDLDLPVLKIVVATLRCKDIANEKLSQFKSSQEWKALEQTMNDDPGAISQFGETARSIFKRYLDEYDDECKFYDEDVRIRAKMEYLESKVTELVYPSYEKLLKHQRSISSRSFKNQLEERLGRGEGFAAAARGCHESSILEFNQRCLDGAIEQANWEKYDKKVREKLERDIEAHTSDIRRKKLSELEDESKTKLSEAIEKDVKGLFDNCGPQTWAAMRERLDSKSEAAVSALSSAIAGFELEQDTVAKMLLDLKTHATNSVEKTSRERARGALTDMRNRFVEQFKCGNNSMPKAKNQGMGKRERKIQKEIKILKARSECLELLSIMAVMGLDNEGRADNVKYVLSRALMNGNADSEDRHLDSDTWDDVPPEKTLITPIQCKALWEEFIVTTDHDIRVAELILKEEEQKNRSFWFILLMVVGDGAAAVLKAIWDPTLIPIVIREFVEENHEDVAELKKRASEFVKSQGWVEQLREWVDQFWRYLRSKYRQLFGTERAYGHRIYQPLLTN